MYKPLFSHALRLTSTLFLLLAVLTSTSSHAQEAMYAFPQTSDAQSATRIAAAQVAVAQIVLAKNADPTVLYAGDTVTYSYVVTNPGDEPLSDVSLTDDTCNPVSDPAGDDNSDSVLDLDETWTYTCATSVLVDTTNTAVVTATSTGGAIEAQDTATVDVINPAIGVDKQASAPTVRVGESVTYSYAVTNQGDDPLSNVALTDDKCTPVAATGGDSNGNSLLDLAETWVYQCTMSLTTGTTNTATATGADSLGATVTAQDTATVAVDEPSIEITKLPGDQTVVTGSDVLFTLVVTNTGDVDLTNVIVTDTLAPDCSRNLGTLAAGASVRYDCALEAVTKSFTNSATVTGTPPIGGDVSDLDTADVHVISPVMEVSKTPDEQIVSSGSEVDFLISVTNQGNVTLYNVTIADPQAPDCDVVLGRLGRGQTKSHGCQLGSVTSGLVNSATATGDTNAGPISASGAAYVRLENTRPCPDGMVAYWRLDETSESAYDDFYVGHDGVCADRCPLPAPGVVNGSQEFDGRNSGINVPAIPGDDSFNWGLGDGFSIEFWMQTDASGACQANEVMVGRDDPSSMLHWWAGCSDGGQARFFLIDRGGASRSIQGTTDLTDGEWHHIVAVRDAVTNRIRLYVDGSQEADASALYSAGFESSEAEINIGWLDLSSGFHFEGLLDEVVLYSRALSTAEAEAHYHQGTAARWTCQTGAYAPTILSTAVTEAVSGRRYRYDVDASGDPAPTYSLLAHPAGMTIDQTTGVISWLPMVADEGQHMVTVEARNTAGFDTQSFMLTVSEGTLCPLDMIAYWKLDEAGGPPYTDMYDGHDGACAGLCPAPIEGQIGNAQAFNGDTTGIDVQPHQDLNWGASDSFSVEFWMYRGGTVPRNEVIVGRDDKPNSFLHWWVGLSPDGGQDKAIFYLIDADGHQYSASGTSDLTDGKWHHVVALRDAGEDEIRLYVDGQLQGSSPAPDVGSLHSATATINIGWLDRQGSTGFHYGGQVDEAAIYGRALSLSEIEDHYAANGSGPGYCINPDLAVVKTADRTFAHVGDTVTYDYAMTNPGDDALSNMIIHDDKCSPVNRMGGDDNADDRLDTDETWTYRCATPINTGTTNTVIVTGTYALGGHLNSSDTYHVDIVHPAISLQKVAEPTIIYSGNTVVYTYTVTNEGDDPLSNVTLVDDKCDPVTATSGDDNGDNRLDVDETWVLTCSANVGTDTTNTATVTGTDSTGDTVSAQATAFVDVIGPQIAIEKVAAHPVIRLGETATYTYTVTNSGDDPLSGVAVGDDRCSPLNYLGGDSNADTKLDPGETWLYRCTSILSADTTNQATATGTDSRGNQVHAQDTAQVRVVDPHIAMSKTANATEVSAGEMVRYSYTVTNSGNDPFSSVDVSDDKCAPVALTGGDSNANLSLDPGETWTFTCLMVLFRDTTNTATATGIDSTGRPLTAQDTVTVEVSSYLLYLPLIQR